jgi:hypothetical protein
MKFFQKNVNSAPSFIESLNSLQNLLILPNVEFRECGRGEKNIVLYQQSQASGI